MNNIDTARIAVIKKKLFEAERRIYEANRIMSNVGQAPTQGFQGQDNEEAVEPVKTSGLYPGQYAEPNGEIEYHPDLSADGSECIE